MIRVDVKHFPLVSQKRWARTQPQQMSKSRSSNTYLYLAHKLESYA